MNNEFKHARMGRGNIVHRVWSNQASCGAGNNTIGTRVPSRPRFTNDLITCKRCLEKIKQEQERQPTPA
jgi:hypothetical protein